MSAVHWGDDEATTTACPGFRYYCPTCDGAGELFTDVNPFDPASGGYRQCWLCNGHGVVTLEQIETADQVDAERCEDYTPPQRTLIPVTEDEPTTPPTTDPWADIKDAS